MDDRRAVVAGVKLYEILGILPIAEIIVLYARYSEMELTYHALINGIDAAAQCLCCFYTRPKIPEYSESMRVSINLNVEQADIGKHWSDRQMFSIGFSNPYWTYYEMNVPVKELMPSSGLKIKARDRDNYVLDIVRDQYLEKIREKMAEI